MIEEIMLENEETKNTITMNKTTTNDYVLGDVNLGQVKSKSSTYKYVNQVGYDKEATLLETRDIEINGWIISTDWNMKTREIQMTQRKNKLNLFVNPQQNINVYYKDYKLSFTPDTSILYGVTYEENNNTIVAFKINGVAYDPCFYDKGETKTSGGAVSPRFHFPLIINKEELKTITFGVKSADEFFYINSKSSLPLGLEIKIKVVGQVLNPIITNVKTSEFLKINKLLEDEIVIINTEIGNRSVISEKLGVKENYFKYKSYDSTWLKASFGENIFNFHSDSGEEGMTVEITYKNKYLEVQQCN